MLSSVDCTDWHLVLNPEEFFLVDSIVIPLDNFNLTVNGFGSTVHQPSDDQTFVITGPSNSTIAMFGLHISGGGAVETNATHMDGGCFSARGPAVTIDSCTFEG